MDLTGSALYERAIIMIMYGAAGAELPGPRGTLQELDLKECPFGDDGARHLAGALRANASLRTLNVSACGLTGARYAHTSVATSPGPQKHGGGRGLEPQSPHFRGVRVARGAGCYRVGEGLGGRGEPTA